MKKSNRAIVALTIAILFTVPFVVRAGGQDAAQGSVPQTSKTSSPVSSPELRRVAEGELSAEQLLVLMDTNKNGRVSKREFMAFMEAEFDYLDKNKDGELDVRELTKAQMRSVAVAAGK